MEVRVCPQCNKAFYAHSDAERLACTHCGHVLYDRRDNERVSRRLKFRMAVKSGSLPAKLVDYSTTGLKAVYEGPELEADSILEIDIDELDIHTAARTVWSSRVSKSACASGFKFLN